MATIKAIEGRSVHQIQSGQVIVDLCSVVKELVENSLDAGATSIDVRFKNNGLDSIEVQDNGHGISPENYETIALKHYTSKLSTYDDLTSLTTFGFRGEALSSLCALSKFHIVTARADSAPKGTRLDFDVLGKLKGTSVVASQKGTTVVVENLFHNLPVRRRELEKNIKREYGKVLGILHAYACISTGVRFAVSNQAAKGKKLTVFSTKSNPTTKENIANVYGAKTLLALVPLELQFELQPTRGSTQSLKNWSTQDDLAGREVTISGHISRPVVGEGRQTPDRQMFFVNSRPCGLPQVAKTFNEVYKSYNTTQSPFIFANLKMDTNAYDVNVSPDKRTILLHDQTALLESLKEALTKLFEEHEQSVPQASFGANKKLPAYKQLTMDNDFTPPPAPDEPPDAAEAGSPSIEASEDRLTSSSSIETTPQAPQDGTSASLIQNFVARDSIGRSQVVPPPPKKAGPKIDKPELARPPDTNHSPTPVKDTHALPNTLSDPPSPPAFELPKNVQDFNERIASQAARDAAPLAPPSPAAAGEETIHSISNMPQKSTAGPVQNAFDRMRPKRAPAETATITIGDVTTRMTIGTPPKKRRIHTPKKGWETGVGGGGTSSLLFGRSLQAFSAPGTQIEVSEDEEDVQEEEGETDEGNGAPTETTGAGTSSAETGGATQKSMESTEDPVPVVDDTPLFVQDDDGSDGEYIDEDEKKAREEARVAQMIAKAEEAAARPTTDNIKRANTVLKGRVRKDSTLHLVRFLDRSVASVERSLQRLNSALSAYAQEKDESDGDTAMEEATGDTAEERLSLTVAKSDFGRMRVIGQFNLGFILAVRPAPSTSPSGILAAPTATQFPLPASASTSDELFIIDQHASDEKYNFERLQASTIVQTQRLVHPLPLDLTAVEEEIILTHPDALTANGFNIAVDMSGEAPVGQRCRLESLPMSRETTFNPSDLEELLVLLSESGGRSYSTDSVGSSGVGIPRPSKVRKMFAMRACRSSIMVGQTLTRSKMEKVVRHMGEIEKPWNCPHGRPTMRHLLGLGDWKGWEEGRGLVGLEEEGKGTDWGGYLRGKR
ncbi:ATP-binding mismatch repair protein [Coniosporium tulheliwenetii]|uniref:ATP-binding mismatch repair protein n=1 Tax=Coniosporium tulheliwenetii TaxID=3383036 RepID=A0ACC2YP34_9PEZI|nr:ATP-binding mismatch repair protein [Cladosporium sp. JES 115]